MAEYDVTILTDHRYVNPAEPGWYERQVLEEDGLVAEALRAQGLRVDRVDWARPDVDWVGTRCALFRTTWDYFYRFDEFRPWLDRVAALTTLINDVETIRWNLDKRYLQDLAERGVPVVPCHFIEHGSNDRLETVLERSGWDDTVLKPVVSGSARETYRVTWDNAAEHAATFRRLVAAETMMLQPFQKAILEEGELSLMVVDGRFTHAVRKVARTGDFRVQDDHGGTVHDHSAAHDEIAFAEAAVAACSPAPAYARVDAVRDNAGRLALMELELVEPEMFFRLHPPAAERLAETVAAALQVSS